MPQTRTTSTPVGLLVAVAIILSVVAVAVALIAFYDYTKHGIDWANATMVALCLVLVVFVNTIRDMLREKSN